MVGLVMTSYKSYLVRLTLVVLKPGRELESSKLPASIWGLFFSWHARISYEPWFEWVSASPEELAPLIKAEKIFLYMLHITASVGEKWRVQGSTLWQGQLSCLMRRMHHVVVYYWLLDQSQRGSLFTLFLNNPLMAFLFVSGLSSMRRGLWEKCQDYLRKINRDIAQLLTHSRSIGMSSKTYMLSTENLETQLELARSCQWVIYALWGKCTLFLVVFFPKVICLKNAFLNSVFFKCHLLPLQIRPFFSFLGMNFFAYF